MTMEIRKGQIHTAHYLGYTVTGTVDSVRPAAWGVRETRLVFSEPAIIMGTPRNSVLIHDNYEGGEAAGWEGTWWIK